MKSIYLLLAGLMLTVSLAEAADSYKPYVYKPKVYTPNTSYTNKNAEVLKKQQEARNRLFIAKAKADCLKRNAVFLTDKNMCLSKASKEATDCQQLSGGEYFFHAHPPHCEINGKKYTAGSGASGVTTRANNSFAPSRRRPLSDATIRRNMEKNTTRWDPYEFERATGIKN